MKKIYIIPQMDVTVLQLREQILEPSVTVNSGRSVDAASVDVKSSRREGYNVWNDDWSE